MNRIHQLFQKKQKDILSIFITAGYPSLNSLPEILIALQEAGVDMVEIGMPFSDPTADGPVIQQSNNTAIANGMTLKLLMQQLHGIREMITMPLILMGYLNPPMQYGFQRFLDDASERGIDGIILPDLPLEEYETYYKELFDAKGLSNIFLVTPQTPENRIRRIDALSNGFIYVVSTSTITGGEVPFEESQREYFSRIKNMGLSNPALVGFGIRDKATFEIACKYLNGAIIGTAFIKALENAQDISATVHQFVHKIKTGD